MAADEQERRAGEVLRGGALDSRGECLDGGRPVFGDLDYLH